MRGILIDPVARTVTEVETTGKLDDLYRLIQCRNVDTVDFADGVHSVYVDGYGLEADEPGPFFELAGGPQPYAGRGLMLRHDDEGECIAATLDLDFVRARVDFPDIELAGFQPIPDGTVLHHPVFGTVPVVGHRAVFTKRGA